jgi:predicted O-methyltransferase YrrM
MSLIELVDNSRTDKNVSHSYLGLYGELLKSKRETAENVMEIGICNGGSIKLWHDYFKNARVYGVDIMHINNVWEGIKRNERIILHTSVNAYDDNFVKKEFNGKKFDFILDDGDHTLESMKKYIRLYTPLLKEDGILIIEDVYGWDWIEKLRNEVPEELKKYVESYDLREIKGRFDDIVFVINKSKKL